MSLLIGSALLEQLLLAANFVNIGDLIGDQR